MNYIESLMKDNNLKFGDSFKVKQNNIIFNATYYFKKEDDIIRAYKKKTNEPITDGFILYLLEGYYIIVGAAWEIDEIRSEDIYFTLDRDGFCCKHSYTNYDQHHRAIIKLGLGFKEAYDATANKELFKEFWGTEWTGHKWEE